MSEFQEDPDLIDEEVLADITDNTLSVAGLDLTVLRACEAAGEGVYLAGGALRSIVDGTKIADYDIFFKNEKLKQDVLGILVGRGFDVVFRCPIGQLVTLRRESIKVQLITIAYHEDIGSVIFNFDLTACCAVYEPATGRSLVHVRFAKDVQNKTIRFNVIQYPLATWNRARKYEKNGYRIGAKGVKEFIEKSATSLGDETIKKPWRAYVD